MIVSSETWRLKAACRGMDTNLFFPERGSTLQVAAIKAVCSSCPVKDECLNHAIVWCETVGIWGGKSQRQLKRMRNE